MPGKTGCTRVFENLLRYLDMTVEIRLDCFISRNTSNFYREITKAQLCNDFGHSEVTVVISLRSYQ